MALTFDNTDILEIISENIEAHDFIGICKLVEHYGSKNKNIFSCFLINLYCRNYINKNLWFLKEFGELIINIEKCIGKTRDDCFKYLKDACLLLSVNDSKKMELLKNTQNDIIKNIERILIKTQKEYEDLLDFKEHIYDDDYLLLNVLYHNLAYGYDLQDSFMIIQYIITKKKKDLLRSNHFNDGIDIIFTILLKFIDNNRVSPDIKTYVMLCKDLFYYRCRQKDRLERINLLFYAIFIIINKKVKYQEVEYKKLNVEKKETNCNYLYVLIKYDINVMNMVKTDRDNLKYIPKEKKVINFDKNYYEDNSSGINVIKD